MLASLAEAPPLFPKITPSGGVSPRSLVCSPNREHYRGMEKTGPEEFGAIPLYFPHWTLDELYAARPFMCDSNGKPILANNKEVDERVLRFGLIPRHVFAEKGNIGWFESRQTDAIRGLKEETLRLIMEVRSRNEGLEIDGSDLLSPSSYVVAYESTFPFTSKTIVIASAYVEEAVWRMHRGLLWQHLTFEPPPTARYIFEEYCRETLANSTDAEFLIRPATGKKENEKAKGTQDLEYFNRNEIKWPIEKVDAQLQDISLQSGVLYQSLSETQKLVDALVKREDGGVDGFQYTIGKDHTCPPKSLGEFASKFGTPERPFRLYYVVPSINYQTFITDPVKPVVTNAEVKILRIPPPLSS